MNCQNGNICVYVYIQHAAAAAAVDCHHMVTVPFPSCRVSPTFIIDFFQRKNDEKSDAPVRNVDHFCLNVEADDINAVKQHLEELGVQAEEQFDGFVVKRFGAQGTAMSIYLK
jgi:hypothetical protein